MCGELREGGKGVEGGRRFGRMNRGARLLYKPRFGGWGGGGEAFFLFVFLFVAVSCFVQAKWRGGETHLRSHFPGGIIFLAGAVTLFRVGGLLSLRLHDAGPHKARPTAQFFSSKEEGRELRKAFKKEKNALTSRYLLRYTFRGSTYSSKPSVLMAHKRSSPLMVLRFSR